MKFSSSSNTSSELMPFPVFRKIFLVSVADKSIVDMNLLATVNVVFSPACIVSVTSESFNL